MMRTCACLGVEAAIIEPAGFRIADSRFRRAGMDYVNALTIKTHDSWGAFAAWLASSHRRLALLTTKGETSLWDFAFREGDVILVGRESAGVPESVMASADVRLRIPNSTPAALSQCGNRGDDGHDRSAAPNWASATCTDRAMIPDLRDRE